MLLPLLRFWSVVISDQHGILLDTHIAFQAAEQVLGQMSRIPLDKRSAQALAQLVDNGLGDQGHCHLAQADMKIEGASALPTQVLVETEELLDVPALRKISRQGRHLRASPRAAEA